MRVPWAKSLEVHRKPSQDPEGKVDNKWQRKHTTEVPSTDSRAAAHMVTEDKGRLSGKPQTAALLRHPLLPTRPRFGLLTLYHLMSTTLDRPL